MSPLLEPLAALETNPHVLVLGEAILDDFMFGSSDRLSQEAPVPVVDVGVHERAPGGAANVAANLVAMGARASLVSVVGEDAEAEDVRRIAVAAGVGAEAMLPEQGRRTLSKSRVISGGQVLVRLDEGSTGIIGRRTEWSLIEAIERSWASSDALVISDYGYGVVTSEVIRAIVRLQRDLPKVVVVDGKDLRRFRKLEPTAVKPNHRQAIALLGSNSAGEGTDRAEVIEANGERLLRETGARIVAVTLDDDGAIVLERDRPSYRTYAKPVRASLTCGAGDTFAAALAIGLAAGSSTPAAAELASAAAEVVVGRDGTALCTSRDLIDRLSGPAKVAADPAEVSSWADAQRRAGRRIVLTSGCFDLLHRGHVTYLSRAKSFGDVLIVGVNTDSTVASLKGPDRPVNPLSDRMEVLAALSCVDRVCWFDEPTPEALVRAIRPEVFVKGGDYVPEMLPEASAVRELGGQVRIVPYFEDRSTSRLIETIRASHMQTQAEQAARAS